MMNLSLFLHLVRNQPHNCWGLGLIIAISNVKCHLNYTIKIISNKKKKKVTVVYSFKIVGYVQFERLCGLYLPSIESNPQRSSEIYSHQLTIDC